MADDQHPHIPVDSEVHKSAHSLPGVEQLEAETVSRLSVSESLRSLSGSLNAAYPPDEVPTPAAVVAAPIAPPTEIPTAAPTTGEMVGEEETLTEVTVVPTSRFRLPKLNLPWSKKDKGDPADEDSQNIPLQKVEDSKPKKPKWRRRFPFRSNSVESLDPNEAERGVENPAFVVTHGDVPLEKEPSIRSGGVPVDLPVPTQPPVTEEKSESTMTDPAPAEPTARSAVRIKAPIKRGRRSSEEINFVQFVTENFKHRDCSIYVKSLKSAEGDCGCGRPVSWHTDKGYDITKSKPNTTWDPTKHTRMAMASAFGEVTFSGFGPQISNSPYVRIDFLTSPALVWSMMKSCWNIPTPNLILSFTGGTRRFTMDHQLKTIFQRDLINLARQTGAWLIGGGISEGVSRFVGEALANDRVASSSLHRIIALGVAGWGIIDNKERLNSDEGEGCFPAHYSIHHLHPSDHRVAALDHNYTHFILVDDGTNYKNGREKEFRIALEQYMTDNVKTGEHLKERINLPLVQLVLEGGFNTLETVRRSIIRGVPVVLIQGSGKMADIISYAYQNTRSRHDEDKTIYSSNFEEDCTGFMLKTLGLDYERDREKIKKALSDIRECLEDRKLMSVFRLEAADTKGIDRVILNALMKANKSSGQIQLNLALNLNRTDVVRTRLNLPDIKSSWQHIDYDDSMFSALLHDRVEFVELFLDYGIDLKTFLTLKRLRDLYDEVTNDQSEYSDGKLLKSLVHCYQPCWNYICFCCKLKLEHPPPNLLNVIGNIITYLLDGQVSGFYKGPHYVIKECPPDEKQADTALPKSPNKTAQMKDGTNNGAPTNKKEIFQSMKTSFGRLSKAFRGPDGEEDYDFIQPSRELFIWSVLLNRRKFAKFFWKQCDEPLGAALCASLMLKSLSCVALNHEEIALSNDLLHHSKEFGDLACCMLDYYSSQDPVLTSLLLIKEQVIWGGATPIYLAGAAKQFNFFSKDCVQNKLSQIWKGYMVTTTPFWKIILSSINPFVLFFVRFLTCASPLQSHDYEDIFIQSPVLWSQEENIPFPKDSFSCLSQSGDTKEELKEYEKPNKFKVMPFTCRDNHINFFLAIYYYYTSPVAKFIFHLAFYLIFLTVFTIFVLTDLRPSHEKHSPSPLEAIIWAWSLTFIFEEIRFISGLRRHYRLFTWLCDRWNIFDLIAYTVLIIAIILRWTIKDEYFEGARITYSIALILFYLRFIPYLSLSKCLGLRFFMIERVFTDLVFFLAVLAILILGFGSAIQATLYPNHPLDWDLLKEILYKPYWQFYKTLFLREIEGLEGRDECRGTTPGIVPVMNITTPDNTTLTIEDYEIMFEQTLFNESEIMPTEPPIYNDTHYLHCPQQTWLPAVLTAVYMLLTNILLINFLIALFCRSLIKEDESEKRWFLSRYTNIYKYFDRPTLVPPLNIINIIYRIITYLCCCCCDKYKNLGDSFKAKIPSCFAPRLSAYEKMVAAHLLYKEQQDHHDVFSNATNERLERVLDGLDHIKDQVYQHKYVIPAPPGGAGTAAVDSEALNKRRLKEEQHMTLLSKRIYSLEEKLNHQSDQIKLLVKLMQDLTTSQHESSANPDPPASQVEISGGSAD